MSTISLGPAAESKPIREIAYETLKHAIITGDLPAGSRIVETDYAERMHISRTPLREALRKLERDGLVEYMLRRGVIVRAFTIACPPSSRTPRLRISPVCAPSSPRWIPSTRPATLPPFPPWRAVSTPS